MEYFDTAHITSDNSAGTIFGYAAECWMANVNSDDFSVKVAISKQDMNGNEINHYELCTTLPLSLRSINYQFCSIGGDTICPNPTDPLLLNYELSNIFYKNESDKEPLYYKADLDSRTIYRKASLDMAPNTDIEYHPTFCLNESIKNSDDLLLDKAQKSALLMREMVICPHTQITFLESDVGMIVLPITITLGSFFVIASIVLLYNYVSNKNTYTPV